jgi:hypothetical protein
MPFHRIQLKPTTNVFRLTLADRRHLMGLRENHRLGQRYGGKRADVRDESGQLTAHPADWFGQPVRGPRPAA